MSALIVAVLLTLGVSAFCSLLEAFVLSVSAAEIEWLKQQRPRRGKMLERFRETIDETSSAILTLNTIANTMGATLVGALASELLPWPAWLIAASLAFAILMFSEIIPKNMGVAYRKALLPHLVYPILIVRKAMWPFSQVARQSVRPFIKTVKPSEEEQEREILLLAEKSAKEGGLTASERDMISNALSLDDIRVEEIMTPRTVMTAIEDVQTVGDVCEAYKNIPFARLPVYKESIDNVIGLVRRRDILQAHAEEKESLRMAELMGELLCVPEAASAYDALQLLIKNRQQLAVVVDEYGSTAGVVSVEDIIEQLLGCEIYEDSDVAVDMRELARERARKRAKPIRETG